MGRQPAGVAWGGGAGVAPSCPGRPGAGPGDAAPWLEQLIVELQVPPLRTYGLDESRFAELIHKAAAASSMKANPIALSAEELEDILHLAL